MGRRVAHLDETEEAPRWGWWWRFRHYRDFAPSPGVAEAIVAEADRLDASALAPAAKVAAMEDCLAGLGVLAEARRWAASLEAARAPARDRFDLAEGAR